MPFFQHSLQVRYLAGICVLLSSFLPCIFCMICWFFSVMFFSFFFSLCFFLFSTGGKKSFQLALSKMSCSACQSLTRSSVILILSTVFYRIFVFVINVSNFGTRSSAVIMLLNQQLFSNLRNFSKSYSGVSFCFCFTRKISTARMFSKTI